jgi:hypothetical protein
MRNLGDSSVSQIWVQFGFEKPQVPEEIVGVLITELSILTQGLDDDPLESIRHNFKQTPQRSRIIIHN